MVSVRNSLQEVIDSCGVGDCLVKWVLDEDLGPAKDLLSNLRQSHVLAHLKDNVLSEKVERRQALVKRVLLQFSLQLTFANGSLGLRVASPHLDMLDLHITIEAHVRTFFYALHIVDVSAGVLEFIAPGNKEEISRDAQSTTLFVVCVDIAESFVVGHSVMKFFLRGVVADEVSLAVGDLVVELVGPGLTQCWEVLVCEATKDH
jgi:hypothetical protein